MTVRLGMSAKKAPTDAPDSRLDFRNGFVRNADNTLRTGITSPVGAAPVLVTATSTTSPMTVNVAGLDAVAARDGGVVQLCNDGVIPVTIGTAPLSGSRLDVLYIMQHDSSSGVSTPDLDDLAGVFVAQGQSVPSGQPSKPAIPAAAVEIATVLMPAGVTSTSGGGVVITQTFQYTAAAGGIVPFPSQALMKLWTNPVLGQHASVLNDPTPTNNGDYVWNGATWAPLSVAGLNIIVPTNVVNGTVTPTGTVAYNAVTSVELDGVFTSAFDDYLVIIDNAGKSAATNIAFQLCAGGVLAPSTAYAAVRGFESGSTRTVGTTAAGALAAIEIEAGQQAVTHIEVTVFGPAKPIATAVDARASSFPFRADVSGVHSTAAAYDGLRLSPNPNGTITGTVTVYGFRK